MQSEPRYKVARYRVLAQIGHTLLLVQVRIKISIDGTQTVCKHTSEKKKKIPLSNKCTCNIMPSFISTG